jgi:hypothetical protein|tara:strand:- start:1577 stop:1957 length:381 start_codon:yes stop_codon:yes gene_type:complete
MNFTQTFEEFSSGLAPMDLALYAGIGIILWVLFKDKLSPVQKIVKDLLDKVKKNTPSVPSLPDFVTEKVKKEDDSQLFFDLVVSWKQTRDLAEKSGCEKAIEVADQMFPYLSPTICQPKEETKDAE